MAEKKKPAPRARKKKVEAEITPVELAPVETAIEPGPVVTAVEVDVLPAGPVGVTVLDHDQVARRAYEIWRAHGGRAFDNWILAEQELRAEA